MNDDETRRDYLQLITEPDPGRRDVIYRKLAGSKTGQIREVAEAGRVVAGVLAREAEPKELEKALGMLNGLPMMDTWHVFHEISGQAIIRKALSEGMQGGPKAELLRYGIRMFQAAISGGFPLSDISLELTRKAMQEDEVLAGPAQMLQRMNDMLMPEKKMMRLPKERGGGLRSAEKEPTR